MVYLCFLVPVVTVIILLVFYRIRVVWWELMIPVAASILFILIAKAICIHSLTADTEYLGGYVTDVRYYEDWNEYIHRTCTSCSGSGKTRTCHTYDCSYVDYHPEYWTAETTLGSYTITEARYNELVRQFKATPNFVELHRKYHTNDGDMYRADWAGEDATLEPVTTTHGYENRPKACVNVYHFEPVDTADIREYGLYSYPGIYKQWRQDQILGYRDQKAEKKLQLLNAKLGRNKQIRVYFCVFKNKPRDAGHLQEQLWEGSNKNEFIVCIGINDQQEVQWVYDFSWTEKEDMKVDIRSLIESQKKLDLSAAIDFTYQEIQTKWVRRNFKEFDYLTIEPTMKQVVWIFILTAFVNLGLGIWVVKNDIESNVNTNDRNPKNVWTGRLTKRQFYAR